MQTKTSLQKRSSKYLSFEWWHLGISSIDSKVRTALYSITNARILSSKGEINLINCMLMKQIKDSLIPYSKYNIKQLTIWYQSLYFVVETIPYYWRFGTIDEKMNFVLDLIGPTNRLASLKIWLYLPSSIIIILWLLIRNLVKGLPLRCSSSEV